VEKPPLQAKGDSGFVLHSDRSIRDFQVTVNKPSATPFLLPVRSSAANSTRSTAATGWRGPQGRPCWRVKQAPWRPAIIVASVTTRARRSSATTNLAAQQKHLPEGRTVGRRGRGAFEAFWTGGLKRPSSRPNSRRPEARAVLFGHSLAACSRANVLADKRGRPFAAYVIGSASVWARFRRLSVSRGRPSWPGESPAGVPDRR